MEPVATVLSTATTAPAANGFHDRASGSSVPKPSGAGEADRQRSEAPPSLSAAALCLVLGAVEQFRTVSGLGQVAEEAATTTGAETGRERAPATDLARSVDLYA